MELRNETGGLKQIVLYEKFNKKSINPNDQIQVAFHVSSSPDQRNLCLAPFQPDWPIESRDVFCYGSIH